MGTTYFKSFEDAPSSSIKSLLYESKIDKNHPAQTILEDLRTIKEGRQIALMFFTKAIEPYLYKEFQCQVLSRLYEMQREPKKIAPKI